MSFRRSARCRLSVTHDIGVSIAGAAHRIAIEKLCLLNFITHWLITIAYWQ